MENRKLCDWDAATFFEKLTAWNKLANEQNFVFCHVSSLDGFEEALNQMQNASALVCICDESNGYTELNNSPHTRRIKTIFLAQRHQIDNMIARGEAMETLRELFRQFMTALIPERTRKQENNIYIDSQISFTEIDRYFFNGAACAFFQIAVDIFTDLRFNAEEWYGD
jgi:hypothetical protein